MVWSSQVKLKILLLQFKSIDCWSFMGSDAELNATEKIVDTKGSYFHLFHVSLVCKNVENL